MTAQSQPEQACEVAAEVLNGTQSLSSYLVVHRLLQLQEELRPYRGNSAVAEFLNCLRDTLRGQLAFYRLLAKDHREQRSRWEEP